jgi:hypothetical protein
MKRKVKKKDISRFLEVGIEGLRRGEIESGQLHEVRTLTDKQPLCQDGGTEKDISLLHQRVKQDDHDQGDDQEKQKSNCHVHTVSPKCSLNSPPFTQPSPTLFLKGDAQEVTTTTTFLFYADRPMPVFRGYIRMYLSIDLSMFGDVSFFFKRPFVNTSWLSAHSCVECLPIQSTSFQGPSSHIFL